MSGSARIQYVSTPATVSMGDEWFGIASLTHFWIRRRFEIVAALVSGTIREASRIAEVGCGHGLLQRQIEDHYNREVTGFDLNDFALRQTASRISPVCCYDLFQREPEYERHFDLIFLFDVLEHVRDEDPFIEALQYHLTPTGRLVVNVPAFQSFWSRYDEAVGHFRRYNIAALADVARRNRMRVDAWTYWGMPLVPLLLMRRAWLSLRTPRSIIKMGLDTRGPLMNSVLLALSRCEVIPQRLAGTSLMAVLSRKSGD